MLTSSQYITAVVAGISYTVQCAVTVSVPVSQLTIMWTDSSGNQRATIIGFNTTSANLDLSFDSLGLSDAGVYTCTATAEDSSGTALNKSEQHTIVLEGVPYFPNRTYILWLAVYILLIIIMYNK